MGDPPEAPLDDTREFLAQLRGLTTEEQAAAIMILSVGAVLDGKVNRREKKLITRALAETGREDSTRPLEALRAMFARGHEIDAAVVEACAPPPRARA